MPGLSLVRIAPTAVLLASLVRGLCVCAAVVAGGLLAFWLPPLLHWLGRTPEGAHWARSEVKDLHKALKCAAHPDADAETTSSASKHAVCTQCSEPQRKEPHMKAATCEHAPLINSRAVTARHDHKTQVCEYSI